MNILKPFTIFLFVITIVSCSSDDSISNIEEIMEPEISTNIKAISYPHNTGSYMSDKSNYYYNESNQIEKISYGGSILGINYVSDDLIEINLLEENVSNAEIESISSIHLENNVVQNLVTNTLFTAYGSTERTRDSIAYIYIDNYPSKIEYYSKNLDSSNDYNLYRAIDFTVSNGNITKKVTTEGSVIKTSTYEYDNKAHIAFGEFTYETPLRHGKEYILIHDKLGNNNANNITSMTNEFETPYTLTPEYKTINYTRTIDEHNRLVEISISGETIATHASYPSSTTFSDEKGEFTF